MRLKAYFGTKSTILEGSGDTISWVSGAETTYIGGITDHSPIVYWGIPFRVRGDLPVVDKPSVSR